MVILKCWHCDLNTGNRTCVKHTEWIPDGAWNSCKDYKHISKEKRDKQIEEDFPFGWDVPDEV